MSSPNLRVGFDGRCLVSPAAGVRRYVRELFRAIAEFDRDVDLVAVGAPAAARLPSGVSSTPVPVHLPTNVGWTLTGLPRAIRRSRLNLYHAPAYTAPLGKVGPLVVTIHDVSYARHPEWYPYHRDRLRRAFYRRSALAADLVITDSDFSRSEIEAAYGIDHARIVTIPLGVGSPFEPAVPGTADSLPAEVTRPYVLHVGDLHTRRNLGTALAAVLELRARHRSLHSLRLVLAGADRGSGKVLRSVADNAGHPDVLVFLPSSDDKMLVQLYRSACALVYPSRYEGFGLPLLEAMACGTPVVAAQAGAIPEVVGSAGPLIQPDDVRGFAEAFEAVLLVPERSARLRQQSLSRAAEFSWQRTARETVRAYRQCLGALSRR